MDRRVRFRVGTSVVEKVDGDVSRGGGGAEESADEAPGGSGGEGGDELVDDLVVRAVVGDGGRAAQEREPDENGDASEGVAR